MQDHSRRGAPFVTCVSVNELHHLVLFTSALRSALMLQLLGERRVRGRACVCVLTEGGRGAITASVAAAVQVSRCLGMRAARCRPIQLPQTVAAREDVIDLCRRASRASLICTAKSAPRPMPGARCQRTSVREPCARSQGPRYTANLKGFLPAF